MHLFINLPSFAPFLSGIIPRFDSVLILVDFKFHVCCPTKPLVKDFLNHADSFNLVQSVRGSTDEHGHTLDLVLSCGLKLLNIQICNLNFSDHVCHNSNFYSMSASCLLLLLDIFSAIYQNISAHPLDNHPIELSADHLITLFSAAC